MFMNRGRGSISTANTLYYTSLLVFMAKNRQEFVPICEDQNNWGLLRSMMTAIYERLNLTWFPESDPVPAHDSAVGEMFIVMAVQLIRRWGRETGCDIGKMETCIQNLLTLAEQMHSRCRF